LRSAHFYGFTTEEDLHNYRTLKRECSGLHAREEECHFFSYELRTLGNLFLRDKRTFHLGILSKIYGWISDYGQGPLRAFFWLLGAMLFFYGVYEFSGWMNYSPSEYKSLPLEYTLQNIFRPTSQFSDNGLIKIQSGWLAYIGIVQTIVFYILLGLIVFAIRRRFRKEAE